MDYFGFFDRLWRQWLEQQLQARPFVRDQFRLDAAPEPYLDFDAGPSG